MRRGDITIILNIKQQRPLTGMLINYLSVVNNEIVISALWLCSLSVIIHSRPCGVVQPSRRHLGNGSAPRSSSSSEWRQWRHVAGCWLCYAV